VERRWQQKAVRKAFENDRITVFEDEVIQPDGKTSEYTVVEEKAEAVVIVAVNTDQRLALIRQHRYPPNISSFEAPSGEVPRGADSVEVARRELVEETGIRAERFEQLGRVAPWPARLRGWVEVILATELDLSEIGAQNQLGDEGIQAVKMFSPAEVRHLIKSGDVVHGATLSALTLFEAFTHDRPSEKSQ
jgi:ADP-ribose pyrophosphatase